MTDAQDMPTTWVVGSEPRPDWVDACIRVGVISNVSNAGLLLRRWCDPGTVLNWNDGSVTVGLNDAGSSE